MTDGFMTRVVQRFDGDQAAIEAFLAQRREEANGQPIGEVADRLAIKDLRRASGELVGPCPACGGRDRFAVAPRKNVFNCRHCGAHGGPVQLVQHVMACDYGAAVDWLLGEADLALSAAERARREKLRRASEEKRARDQERYRQKAIRDARAIWARARDGNLGVVRAYLAARGIPAAALPQIPRCLRFIADHPYVKLADGRLETMHRGPAMIAAVQGPDDRLSAVHQTWVDPAPPHGKAKVLYQGEAQAAKLVRGSKKGGAIRLLTPAGADTLIMGEGIETTLSALAANPVPNAAYWAGVDLGNMAGIMRKEAGKRWSGLPDMSDADAFVPPAWVRRLVFIQDGDSNPAQTRAKLLSGLRRAMALRPGLVAQIVHAGEGVDLNDVLTGGGT